MASFERRNRSYGIRIQTAIVCSLLMFILLFRYWPASWNNDVQLIGRFAPQDVITPEVLISSQYVNVERTAPPAPQTGEQMPDDVVVDVRYDLELDLSGLHEPLANPDSSGDELLVEQPDRPPNVRRIVEPVMPAQARRDNIRVELEVLFTVSADGKVEEAMVTSVQIFNKQAGEFEPFKDIEYGFRKTVLQAARQWLFYPAEHEGKTVRSQIRHRFTFGNGS